MMTRKQIKETVDNLRCDTVDATPRDFDFEPERIGESWDLIEPDLSDWSNEQLRDYARGEGVSTPNIPTADNEDDDVDDEINDWRNDAEEKLRDHWRENESFVPMMNYLYPIDGCNLDAGEIQARLIGSCVVAVDVGGETFLALAGGGMDLSWEICDAYIRIGCCPPLHFRPCADCRDPDSDRTRLVVAGYTKSIQVTINRATWARKDLRSTVRSLREYKEKTTAAGGTVRP